jgi:hypothetical protein
MIETEQDCNRFQKENLSGDWIMHIVPTEDAQHPANNNPSILFIRNILTGKTYYFAFDHPDSIPIVTHAWFVQEFLINSKNKKWVLDKKAFTQLISLSGIYDANLVGYLKSNSILDLTDYDTSAHNLIRRNSSGHRKVNLVIPLLKHKEVFDELADDITKMIKKFEIDKSFIDFNDLIIGTLAKLESQGIFVDRERFKERFDIDVGPSGIIHSQYNVYTSTGRPSNRFHNVNYAALNHTDGTRKCFCSRYGKDGKMVLIDYSSFFPRIICNLTKYDIPIDVDIYEYLAKLYFQKKDVDETDISNAKKLTFRQMFGGVEDEYAHIKYLANLKTYINEQWDFFNNNGYIVTPILKRKITADHITDPNPPKVFNYILQAVEGEIAIPKINDVINYLRYKKKTIAVLYTYDAVLYDFHKDDGITVLNDIRKIMSYDGKFPMKTYIGETYHDLKLVSL